ncbi:hypothetical protein [Streptomyces sp. NBC_01565]|uniref:ATP-dependent DNA ligase n=1 Tax=Streptomyces sp. NBC_01565 TaxID=2975881 RepID=UPI00224DDC51|nr:hypothetical protein [Streptomyces sp. NBC_01565]MCX4539119.1 hypothetical protein [Streptomyces sp. NBC_01565]
MWGGFPCSPVPESANPRAFAFDVLQTDGGELLRQPYRDRGTQLEKSFTDHALTVPWTLCPMTTDLDTAREWLQSWTDVYGVEGIVIKPLTSRYLTGCRGWTKIRRRDTTEAVIGAVAGTLARPGLLILAPWTPAAGCARSAGQPRCARSSPARSANSWLPRSRGTRGPACASPRRGGRATSWTPAWSARTWWPRSAPTGSSTAAGPAATAG